MARYLKRYTLPANCFLYNSLLLAKLFKKPSSCSSGNELDTTEQYDAQYGKTPLGELMHSIVGLGQKAANEAFPKFLNDLELASKQMYFVRQIMNYIMNKGLMKDFSVLQENPFTDQGSIRG